MTTGKLIKILRNRKNMTQGELAEILGVSINSIQKYESDCVPNLKVDVLKKLSECFGLYAGAFLYAEYMTESQLEVLMQCGTQIHSHFQGLLALNDEGIDKVFSYRQDIHDTGNYSRQKSQDKVNLSQDTLA